MGCSPRKHYKRPNSSRHTYPTCETSKVVEHFSKIVQPLLSTANLADESQLTSQKVNPQTWDDITPKEAKRFSSATKSSSAPGRDAIQNTALKKLKSLHERIAKCFNDLLRWNVCPKEWKAANPISKSKSLRIAPDGHWQARPFTDRFGSSEADVLY